MIEVGTMAEVMEAGVPPKICSSGFSDLVFPGKSSFNGHFPVLIDYLYSFDR